ncbi:MAG: hypothetical protein IH624_07765 [Phycisphaerae bacterium]|nr:hypothetical protein [Phycisphaerae bacterium]
MKKVLIIVAALCFGLTGPAEASLMDGLVGYWPLDGNFKDSSPGGHDAVLLGGTAPFVEGVVGLAADFDGSGSTGADTGTWDPSEGTGQLSISCWAKWRSGGSTWQGLVAKRNDWAAGQVRWHLECTEASLYFQQWTGPGPSNPDGLPVDQWQHVCVTFDGTTAILYRDNVPVATSEFALGDQIDAHVVFGCVSYNGADGIGNPFSGVLDEIAIWNRPLTPDEVALLYNNGNGTPLANQWKPVNPSPANGAVEVDAAGVMLEWDAPDVAAPMPIVKYNVHVSTDIQPLRDPNNMSRLKGSVNAAGPLQFSLSDADLAVNTTYYWRVDTLLSDAARDPNNAYGSIWSFTTQWTKPVIQTHPQNVFVEAGGDAVFAAALRNDLSLLQPVSYAWYDGNNQLVTDGPGVSGATTSQLTISNAGIADLGRSFYCVASNADGSATSNAASLTVKSLVAHYAMDDIISPETTSVLDSSGLEHHGVAVEGVVSAVGINGGSLLFDANGWVDCGPWNPSEGTGQLTVAFWANWGGSNGSWQAVISKRDSWETENFYWILSCNDQDAGRMGWHGTTWAGLGDNILPTGEWTHVAVTFDGANAVMYVNGAQAGGPNAYQFGGKSDAHIYLGAANAGGDLYKGALDDVRIYNYALDDVAVARLYAEFGSGAVCPASQRPQYDYDGDCKVGIGDIAMFVSEWLDCYAVPGCLD